MAHHVIYIPGLGDHHSHGQDVAIQYWRVYGLRPHYLALGWHNKESFESKVKRLIATIDGLIAEGHEVSLSGTSAGASAALAAYAARPNINGVITIAGKIQHPETIGQVIRDENPDFFEGAKRIGENLKILSGHDDLKNILCIYADNDQTVPPEDAIIPGSRKHAVPGWDHGSGIFFGILIGAPKIASFLKSRPH